MSITTITTSVMADKKCNELYLIPACVAVRNGNPEKKKNKTFERENQS
jgi:accessory colonization factor AcfC